MRRSARTFAPLAALLLVAAACAAPRQAAPTATVPAGTAGGVVVTAMRDMLASADGLAWRRIESGDFGSAWYSGVSITGAGAGQSVLVVGHSGRIVRIEQ